MFDISQIVGVLFTMFSVFFIMFKLLEGIKVLLNYAFSLTQLNIYNIFINYI